MMKLSDAIEKGCQGKRQIFGAYYNYDGGVCALEAMSLGMTGESATTSKVFHEWLTANPACGKEIQRMNDTLKLSFDDIVAVLREDGK